MATATCEIMWILKILEDLNVKIDLPVKLFCDNKSKIQILDNTI